jgi:hypothetical protein
MTLDMILLGPGTFHVCGTHLAYRHATWSRMQNTSAPRAADSIIWMYHRATLPDLATIVLVDILITSNAVLLLVGHYLNCGCRLMLILGTFASVDTSRNL